MKYALKTCRYCGDSISELSINRHKGLCAKASPTLREVRRIAREAARAESDPRSARAAAPPAVAISIPPAPLQKKMGRPRKDLAGLKLNSGNDNARRLSITISLDFETLRTLLIKLGPSVSIDKTEVI